MFNQRIDLHVIVMMDIKSMVLFHFISDFNRIDFPNKKLVLANEIYFPEICLANKHERSISVISMKQQLN